LAIIETAVFRFVGLSRISYFAIILYSVLIIKHLLIYLLSDLLVTLLSIEAQSYGPNSLIGIKVVEYCPPTGAPGEKKHENSPVTVPAVQSILCLTENLRYS
jgi:hypothetical protein